MKIWLEIFKRRVSSRWRLNQISLFFTDDRKLTNLSELKWLARRHSAITLHSDFFYKSEKRLSELLQSLWRPKDDYGSWRGCLGEAINALWMSQHSVQVHQLHSIHFSWRRDWMIFQYHSLLPMTTLEEKLLGGADVDAVLDCMGQAIINCLRRGICYPDANITNIFAGDDLSSPCLIDTEYAFPLKGDLAESMTLIMAFRYSPHLREKASPERMLAALKAILTREQALGTWERLSPIAEHSFRILAYPWPGELRRMTYRYLSTGIGWNELESALQLQQ